MNLTEALTKIAAQIDVDPETLIAYAQEDEIGGYHTDGKQQKWVIGSVWGVEGQVLYAVTRALQPSLVMELGTFTGCSTAHICAALRKNGKGTLVTVDREAGGKAVPKEYLDIVEFVQGEAVSYIVNEAPSRRIKLVFEDLMHRRKEVSAVWSAAMEKLVKGGVIISHDAMHHIVGQDVRDGIEDSGHDYEGYLIEPSDCGLAVGVKA